MHIFTMILSIGCGAFITSTPVVVVPVDTSVPRITIARLNGVLDPCHATYGTMPDRLPVLADGDKSDPSTAT